MAQLVTWSRITNGEMCACSVSRIGTVLATESQVAGWVLVKSGSGGSM
jgi:hypothetical protein